MSNIKKIIGVVLALVMALSVATVAFAAPEDNYSITFTADKTTISEGETATVEVKVTANFNVSAMTIPVFFDNTKVSVKATPAATDPAELERTVIAAADSEEYNDLTRFYKGTTYTEADHGVVALNYLPVTGDAIRQYNNETVMTLTVTALAGASGASVIECLSTTVKTNDNPSGTLLIAKNKSGTAVVDSEGEVVDNGNVAGATTTITIAGGAEPADLDLTAAGTTNGVVIDKNKTFGGQYDGAVYGFTQAAANTFKNDKFITTNTQATNGGSLSIKTSDNKVIADGKSGNFGTGATITVLNSDGSTSKTYVVVIFGDLDGNGLINPTDYKQLKAYVNDSASLADNSLIRMAANMQDAKVQRPMILIQPGDQKVLKLHIAGTKYDAKALAAKHASFGNYA